MRKLLACSALLLISVSLFAQIPAPAASEKPAPSASAAPVPDAPKIEVVEAYFKRMFGYETNLQVKVGSIQASPISGLFNVTVLFITPEGQQVGHWYVSSDQKHAIVGELLPFGADPYASERAELAKSAFGPSKGPADAKLLIIEFADLECPACRSFAQTATRLRNDFPNARFVFQSLPLGELHPWAVRASSYLDCIARDSNDRGFTFIDAVYSHQRDIESEVRKTDASGKTTIDDRAVTEQMRKFTEWAGADPAKIQACAESPATAERVKKSVAVAQSVGVTATPTLFVNGRRIGDPGAVQYEGLKQVVSYEAEQAAAGK
jgi:protein-disulfide isomerase